MDTTDTTHLVALQVRLSHEKDRLAQTKTAQEHELRTVWVAGIEREIEREKTFLGITETEFPAMSDDELLAALTQ